MKPEIALFLIIYAVALAIIWPFLEDKFFK